MHTSIKLNSPIELINITPVNPLISKCQIKVCYVGDQPNRNGSVITKDAAIGLAQSLPGSPIVGFWNEAKEDFEEHNRIIDISNGKFDIKDTTRPYGFVDLNAKVWFEWYQDDGIPHEYLCTEGYLWTGQYPECERIIEKGNNQSMELDEKTLKADWATLDNGYAEFFIINEAIISKLCILGEDVEPCFEGSQITGAKVQFSFDESFKNELFSMMNQMKQILEGGTPVFTRYAVQIGDSLWTALYNALDVETYSIAEVCQEDDQIFAVLHNTQDDKYYRLNIQADGDAFVMGEEFAEIADYQQPADAQFSLEDVEAFKKKKDEESKSDSEEDDSEEKENKKEEKKPDSEDEDEDEESEEDKKKKKKYNLEEVTEYSELMSTYSALQNDYEALKATVESLQNENANLVEFKKGIDRQAKQEMIKSFYMLSDEDKSDVIKNIDTYSLDDIEAKLSVICVRNKVSFALEQEKDGFTLGVDGFENNSNLPAWVKAVSQTQKSMNE